MRILGSGKIDDYQKVVLSDRAVEALNVKSGDSVLFYCGCEGRVEMFKAEGAQVTEECDSRPRLHLRGARRIVYGLSTMVLALLFLGMVLMVLDYRNVGLPVLGDRLLMADMVLMAVSVLFILSTVHRMDKREKNDRLVCIGGPYTKDRLFRFGKAMSDTAIISGNLYVNSLFGSNPYEIKAVLDFDDGDSAVAFSRCTKDIPGYSVHKIRVPIKNFSDGKITFFVNYLFKDKMVAVTAKYSMSAKSSKSHVLRVKEDGVTAELVFDDKFQRSTFDESLFDPSDDDIVM